MSKKRLYKSSIDKKVCGVCGGLSEYLNLDATLIRLLFALVSLFWFTGILIYAVMAFVIPFDNEIN